MALYHIVLFKMKPTTPEKITEMHRLANAMIGTVPGLKKINLGPPILDARAKGFNHALVAILGTKDDLAVYAEHEAHLKVTDYVKTEIGADDVLGYDFEFEA